MALDIIYPIILTPIAFAVGYGIHAFRKSMKQELPEAKPYEFERDEYKHCHQPIELGKNESRENQARA